MTPLAIALLQEGNRPLRSPALPRSNIDRGLRLGRLGGCFAALDRVALQRFGRLRQMPEGFVVVQVPVQLAAEISHAPSAERQHDDAELATAVGEGVGGAGRMIGIEVAAHQAVGLKRFQPG